jgi:chemotaxis protein methyltransferase WspC
MKRIEQRLREAMGLDASSIGSSVVQRTVRLRMKAQGLEKLDDYIALLQSSPAECEELIESVVVNETWFFRDRESFCALVHLVKEEWLPTHSTGALRILSVPCSSGEEPYSLVMALIESGLPPERFRVDAADISERALARARAGLYTKNSFRGKELGFRERYFRKTSDGLILDPIIRSRVSFFRGNIISPDFPVRALYDVIFCRNLLIYFDRNTQKQAITQLRRLLVTNGILFVGPAEQPLIADHGFEPVGIPLAFASRKMGAINDRPVQSRGNSSGVVYQSVPPAAISAATTATTFAAQVEPSRPAKAAHAAMNNLATVRLLADSGNLEEAASICENCLRADSTSPEAWYLLGLIRDARGDAGAVECYRKALYLDPEHYETLLQMALLAERDGNRVRARTFRSRAERLRSKVSGVT